MYARVVTSRADPDRIEEFVRLFDGEIAPQVKEGLGFQGLLLLTNEAGNTSIAVALYDSEASLHAADAGFADRADRAAEVLGQAPDAGVYAVRIQA